MNFLQFLYIFLHIPTYFSTTFMRLATVNLNISIMLISFNNSLWFILYDPPYLKLLCNHSCITLASLSTNYPLDKSFFLQLHTLRLKFCGIFKYLSGSLWGSLFSKKRWFTRLYVYASCDCLTLTLCCNRWKLVKFF